MYSSGTNGKQSKIILDKTNAKKQQLKLFEIYSSIFGKNRLPMLIIDKEATVKDRKQFSARTTAINGFSFFSKNKYYALNEDMDLNLNGVKKFLNEISENNFIIFGFTYLVWEYFIKYLKTNNINMDLSKGFLVHGGGSKLNKKINNDLFKKTILDFTGCSRIHNYYGMVEQTGFYILV